MSIDPNCQITSDEPSTLVELDKHNDYVRENDIGKPNQIEIINFLIVIETDESSDREWLFQPSNGYNSRSKRTSCPCGESHKLEYSKLQRKLKKRKFNERQLFKQTSEGFAKMAEKIRTLEAKLEEIMKKAEHTDSLQKIITLQAKLIKSYEAERELEDTLNL